MKLNGKHCQCGGCGLYFRSLAAFDSHRVGPYTNRNCLGQQQMQDAGMTQDARGFWKCSSDGYVWPKQTTSQQPNTYPAGQPKKRQ